MSVFVCSLSGAPVVEGVVSTKSGHLYEKSTILKFIAAYHKCPHSNQPLEEKDLVAVRGSNSAVLANSLSVSSLT